MFVMISGALLLSSNRVQSYRTVYSKYVIPKIISFLLWSAFYALFDFFVYKNTENIFYQFITGHYHLWFLFMIVGIYMISPFLKVIAENKRTEQYFLLLGFVFAVFIPSVLLFMKWASAWKGECFSLADSANTILSNLQFHFAMGFSFYFVLGHYLHTTSFSINSKMEVLIYLLGIIAFSLSISLNKLASFISNSAIGDFMGSFTLNSLFENVAIFTFAKCRLAKLFSNEQSIARLQKLSSCCFGVYCVHAFFLELFEKLGLTTLSFHPVLAVLVIAFMVFAASLFVTTLLKKLPLLGKYLTR